MPKVSVVLTSYNHENFLKESIESILNQTLKDFECYIIDDCSTDNSWDIIEKYSKKDKRIIAIRHKKNIGGIIEPNLINKLKGEYFCIAHCDDKWEKEKLKKQVEYMDNHKEVAACFTWIKLINEKGEEIDSNNGKTYTNFNIKDKSRYEFLNHFFYNGNCLCHPSVMLRTKVQKEENLYANGLGAIPDLYRWIKLSLKHKIYIYEEKLACFRVRENAKNTSGYNENNLIRYHFDLLPALSLYKNIKDDEFLKIFPEAKEYVVDGKINIPYALARLCIDKVKIKPYILFGLLLIYEEIQDSKKREELEKLYNYSKRSFTTETGKYDLFNIINHDMILNTSVFFDDGMGFSEDNKINIRTLLKENKFKIVFSDINKNVMSLRVDPDELRARSFKNLKIYINGQEVEYNTNDSIVKDEILYFLTTDPICSIDYKGVVNTVEVIGETNLIGEEELIKLLKEKYQKKSIFNFFKRKRQK